MLTQSIIIVIALSLFSPEPVHTIRDVLILSSFFAERGAEESEYLLYLTDEQRNSAENMPKEARRAVV